ncbi:MAG: hypothetical protein ACI9TH_001212 [Kiritimatiellia bacterium]|jgi:hypothetical protein
MRVSMVVFVVLLSSRLALGIELNWSGSNIPLIWSDASNWTTNQVPGSADNVVFSDPGADVSGSNLVTSVMDLAGTAVIDGLRFVNTTGLVHRLDLDGNTLQLTGDFAASVNQLGQDTQATIENGSFVIGDSTNRVDNLRVGFFNASGNGDQHANIRMDLSSIDAWVDVFDVGRRIVGGSVVVDPILDLSASGTTTIDAASRVYIGTVTGNSGSGVVSGSLLLSTNGVSNIRTPEIWIGDSPGQGNTGVVSEFVAGLNTTLLVNDIAVGRRKSHGRMSFPAGLNGTLNISGHAGPEANLFIGYNMVPGTGTQAQGTVDMSGGTLNAVLDRLEIGRHDSGSGSGQGTLLMGGGQLSANEVRLAITDQGGVSFNDSLTTAMIQLNGGTMTVANDFVDGNGLSTLLINRGDVSVGGQLSVDELDVGVNQGPGTLTVLGAVRIGTGGETIELGRRTFNGSAVSSGVLDFSKSPSVDIDVANIHLAQVPLGGNGGFFGNLILGTNAVNTITADNIRIGDSNSPGNTQVTSFIHLGAVTNQLNVNWLYVGQRKSKGIVDVMPGGVVKLRGRTGGRLNLRAGYNNAGTATQAEGTFDMTGGLLDAQLGSVILGFHGSTTGNGRGTFVMDQGTVDAESVSLAHVGIGGVSVNPLNTRGNLIINGGEFRVAGAVVDQGGTSLLQLNQGLFAARGDFLVDNVTLSTPVTGSTVLVLHVPPVVPVWKVDQYNQANNTTLRLNLSQGNPVFQATNATFAAGSLIDFGLVDGGLPNTNRAEATVWTAGTNTWDDITDTRWSAWVPAGASINTSDSFTILAATNLVDNGVASANPDFSLTVTPGASGTIAASYTGSGLKTGQIGAILDDPTAQVTRTGDLLLGNAMGSGAAATGVQMTDGFLSVNGSVLHDGGFNYFLLDGGTVDVLNGRFDVDEFRLGYLNRSGTLTVGGGTVRIGQPTSPGIVDVARREGNVQPAAGTIATADFEGAMGVEIHASSLRIGTSDNSNGPSVEGRLFLADSGTNRLLAQSITIADSLLQGQGAESPASPESLLNFGATTNIVVSDFLTIGNRKARGRAVVPTGGSLTLSGQDGPTMDLRIGYNITNTGTTSTGTLDAGLGMLNGALGSLSIGRHDQGNGAGQGTFVMGAGVLTANQVNLARVSVTGSANPANTTAAMILNGGRLSVAGSIQDLGGVSTLTIMGAEVDAASVDNLDTLTIQSGSLRTDALTGQPGFQMTGGRLTADLVDFDLTLSGGTLAPGIGIGRTVIQGNHNLQNGHWEIDVEQGTNDVVIVSGALSLDPALSVLDVSLVGAPSNTVVIAEYGSLSGTFASENIPVGYSVDYTFQGTNQIALVSSTGFSLESNVRIANGMAEIRWQSEAGATYGVWRSESLSPPNWIRIATGLSDTAPLNAFTDPDASSLRGYYRIARE